MKEPVIFAKQPAVVELEAGTYYWCSCGRSRNQPHCDGSHRGTGFVPVEFVIEEKKRFALCQCKHTQNAPFCDGAHQALSSG